MSGTPSGWVQCLFMPFILLWQSFRIYLVPLVAAYTPNLWNLVCHWGQYQDKKFPSDAFSLGGAGARYNVVWKRTEEIFSQAGHQNVALFHGDPVPEDIMQGKIGNCWLMSAFACLATVPGGIQSCFVTKRYNKYGKYAIRMYQGRIQKWRTITVSDDFPCNQATGQPIFAKPNGDEAWVLIAEKAFAKMMGSYKALDGGNTAFALQTLTGDPVCTWKYDTLRKSWGMYGLVHLHDSSQSKKGRNKKSGRAPSNAGKANLGMLRQRDTLNQLDMFKYLRQHNKKNALLAASAGGGGNDTQSKNGIVQGHAYAVLRVKAAEGLRFIRFRNPWGRFEWKGPWSDNSPLWKQYPKIAEILGNVQADDGAFWMEWEDVLQYFHNFDVCIRTRGFRDHQLDYNEEADCCGPGIGCCTGCFSFWCCCQGCLTLHRRHQDNKAASIDPAVTLAQDAKGRVTATPNVRSSPPSDFYSPPETEVWASDAV